MDPRTALAHAPPDHAVCRRVNTPKPDRTSDQPATPLAGEGMGSVSPIPSACTTTGMRVTADDCGGDDGRLATLLDQYEPEWAVRQWGFDTIVFRFKLDHPQAVASLVNPFAFGNTDPRADPTEGTFDPDTGSPRAVTVRDSGNWMMNLGFAQVSGFPQTGLVNVQCRPSALIAQDEENRDLAHPTDLAAQRWVPCCLGADPS